MVTPVPPAGRRLLVVAGLLAALLASPPAAAGDATATMTVRARVVDRCRVRLPDPVPPDAHARLPDHVGDLIEQRCHRPLRPQITAGPLPGRPGGRRAPSDVAWRQDGRGHVLITLTY